MDVLLLVEVADSSLIYDQTDKRDAYARNGIAEYWLVDLTRNQLIVFRDSDGRAFQTANLARPAPSPPTGRARRNRRNARWVAAPAHNVRAEDAAR